MPSLVTRIASSASRRLLPAASLAAAAVLVGFAVGSAPTASAAWDMDEFYACWDPEHDAFNAGDITGAELADATLVCCLRSEGQYGPDGVCRAPTAIASSTPFAPPSEVANPDVPAGPPPIKPGPKPLTPKTSLTLAPSPPIG